MQLQRLVRDGGLSSGCILGSIVSLIARLVLRVQESNSGRQIVLSRNNDAVEEIQEKLKNKKGVRSLISLTLQKLESSAAKIRATVLREMGFDVNIPLPVYKKQAKASDAEIERVQQEREAAQTEMQEDVELMSQEWVAQAEKELLPTDAEAQDVKTLAAVDAAMLQMGLGTEDDTGDIGMADIFLPPETEQKK